MKLKSDWIAEMDTLKIKESEPDYERKKQILKISKKTHQVLYKYNKSNLNSFIKD
jgi:hypothetical protein